MIELIELEMLRVNGGCQCVCQPLVDSEGKTQIRPYVLGNLFGVAECCQACTDAFDLFVDCY